MIPVNRDLPRLIENVPKKNTISSYLPLRNKGNDFNWSVVVGLFLGASLGREIKKYDFDAFVTDCRNSFALKLDEPDFWYVIEEMYFKNNAIYSVAPECLLFGSQKQKNCAADERMGAMFCSLLGDLCLSDGLSTELNFLEQQIVDVLKKRMSPISVTRKESPYLPYLSRTFQKDIQFLADRPKYLLDELQNFLELYGFLYCSQLALNLQTMGGVRFMKRQRRCFLCCQCWRIFK